MPRLRQALTARRPGIPFRLRRAAGRGTRISTRVRLRPGRRTGIGPRGGIPGLLRLRARLLLRTRPRTGIPTRRLLPTGVPVRLRLRSSRVRARLRWRPGVPALLRTGRVRTRQRRTVRTGL